MPAAVVPSLMNTGEFELSDLHDRRKGKSHVQSSWFDLVVQGSGRDGGFYYVPVGGLEG